MDSKPEQKVKRVDATASPAAINPKSTPVKKEVN